jgi:hypothetical protein
MLTPLDAYTLLVDLEALAPRLDAAAAALQQLPHLEAEQSWLTAARERLAGVRSPAHADLLNRALRLSELESEKSERGKLLQAAVADEVERLQAAITLAGSARSPLLEVLFLNLKVPSLRKCSKPELDKFCAELERRLASSYSKRVLGGGTYKAVAPNVVSFAAAVQTWRNVFVEPPLDAESAVPVREELLAAGANVELAVRQARMLAQAALLPAKELLDAAGVVTKRRKDDTHPLLETDPPDPLLPTSAERAEIADIHRMS